MIATLHPFRPPKTTPRDHDPAARCAAFPWNYMQYLRPLHRREDTPGECAFSTVFTGDFEMAIGREGAAQKKPLVLFRFDVLAASQTTRERRLPSSSGTTRIHGRVLHYVNPRACTKLAHISARRQFRYQGKHLVLRHLGL